MSNAILCPSCRKLISKDETDCPHCGHRIAVGRTAQPLIQVFANPESTIQIFTGFTVLMYIGSLLLDTKSALSMSQGILGFGSPSIQSLYVLGLTGGAAWGCGHLWTLLTATFLHGSLLHIFFNLSWLRSIGLINAHIFGPARFINIYMITGMGGFLASNLWSNTPTIGASCALFGLMGVLIAFGRRRGGELGKNLNRQAWSWAIVGLCIGFAIPQVNNAGHIGGLISGYALAYILPAHEHKRESIVEWIIALSLIAFTLAGFLLSFWRMQGVFSLGIPTC